MGGLRRVLGELTVDNPVVWEKVSQRYDEILDELFPELDYLVFITAETKIGLKGEAYFRMIELVHGKLKARGKKMILRNFSHSPAASDRTREKKTPPHPPGIRR